MNIVQFLASFFYRIRYWLLWGSLLVTALVIYFTQFLPYSYTVNSSLYAGVTNSTNLDGSQLININSTFDNIINIGKSKNTLAKVSVRLLATSLVYVMSGKTTCTFKPNIIGSSSKYFLKKCWLW